jgi:hypothetical protein
MSTQGPVKFSDEEKKFFYPIFVKWMKKEWGVNEVFVALNKDKVAFERFKLFANVTEQVIRLTAAQKETEATKARITAGQANIAYLNQSIQQREQKIAASREATVKEVTKKLERVELK